MTAESSILPEGWKHPKLETQKTESQRCGCYSHRQRKFHESQRLWSCPYRHDRHRWSSVSRLAEEHAARGGPFLLAHCVIRARFTRLFADFFLSRRSGRANEAGELDGGRARTRGGWNRIRIPRSVSRRLPHQS